MSWLLCLRAICWGFNALYKLVRITSEIIDDNVLHCICKILTNSHRSYFQFHPCVAGAWGSDVYINEIRNHTTFVTIIDIINICIHWDGIITASCGLSWIFSFFRASFILCKWCWNRLQYPKHLNLGENAKIHNLYIFTDQYG